MAQLSAKLRSTQGGIAHWCPGCDCAHVFDLARWDWDKNVDAPTLSPSMRWAGGYGPNHEPRTCHYFLRAGQIQFLGDCTHPLKGQAVALPDWPHDEEWDR